MSTNKVIEGPAGHWYALHAGELIGFPMSAGDTLDDRPPHPNVSGDLDGWTEISDPAPETDVDALRRELSA